MMIQTHTSVVLQTENRKPPAKAVLFACSEAVVNKPDRNLFWVSLSVSLLSPEIARIEGISPFSTDWEQGKGGVRRVFKP